MPNDDISSFHVHRRQFLIAGSVAAAGLAASNLSASVAGRDAVPMPLLSVGFSNRTFEELRSDESRRIVPADRLAVADMQLAQSGARVTVRGFHRGAAHRGPLHVGLHAYSPAVDPATGAKTPFLAWACRYGAPGAFAGNHNTFVVPADAAGALQFGVDRLSETARGAAPIWRMARLSGTRRDARAEIVALSASGIKLRRGTYFIAVRESETDRTPSWMSVRVRNGALETVGGGEPPFSYLVLSVDPTTIG